MALNVDRRPGGWVAKEAARRGLVVWSFAAVLIALALVALALVVSSRATAITSILVIVAAFLLKWLGDKRVDRAVWARSGARAEIAVGEELDHLTSEGFVVRHDVDHLVPGNIDHLVSGATGVFMVETKARAYLDRHLPKARWHAKAVHDRLGIWVTPVICIERPAARPKKRDGVWIVPRHCLCDWIRAQRNAAIDDSLFLERVASATSRAPVAYGAGAPRTRS